MAVGRRVVVACDKFKGSLDAEAVNSVIAREFHDAGWQVDQFPIADGGDGTLVALTQAGARLEEWQVPGPVLTPVTAHVARLPDGTAVVELADACGMGHLVSPAPWDATTVGLGEIIGHALTGCPGRIVVGLGGSGSNDGGAGLLVGLGARLTDAAGASVPPTLAGLERVARVDLDGLDPRLAGVEVVAASDVVNPLLGPTGAIATFGPQKGLAASELGVAEEAMAHWADVVEAATGVLARDRAGAGAAGGAGFALISALGARACSGIELVADLTGLADAIAGADLVVTGEGSLDCQTLGGKAVAGVAGLARAHGVPVDAVCGRCTVSDAELRELGVNQVVALSSLEPDVDRSMAHAAALLGEASARLARTSSPGR